MLHENQTRDFWDEVQQVRASSGKYPNIMDGVSGENDVLQCFADQYEALYRSVSYDETQMEAVRTEVDAAFCALRVKQELATVITQSRFTM